MAIRITQLLLQIYRLGHQTSTGSGRPFVLIETSVILQRPNVFKTRERPQIWDCSLHCSRIFLFKTTVTF